MKTKLTLKALTLTTFLFLFCSLSEVEAQNVGINGSGALANTSALLDLDDAAGGNNKGLLIPRIALTAINLAAPVTSPATSLLVYNTASASTGTNAVSAGYYYWDGVKWVRFAYNASGSSSTAWDLLGNAGTNPSTNFIGTTDDQDLIFKRNNIRAGLLNSSLKNTSYGIGALNSANTGTANTVMGYYSMPINTTGSNNTANGLLTLYNNTTGSNNTALGNIALFSNISGSLNVGVGQGVLYDNTSGNDNVGMGYGALRKNTSGDFNTAVGSNSPLHENIIGNLNTAVGYRALYFSTTNNNTAIGASAAGTNSLNIYGDNNTFLGARADVVANNLTNATAIGYNAKVGANNALILGGTGADAVNVGIGITTPQVDLHVVSSNNSFGGAVARFQRSGSTSFVQTSIDMPAGGFSGLSNTGDHILTFSNDANPALDASTGLLIAPWSSATNPTGNFKGLKIMESGDVAIGIATPSSVLHVVKNQNAQTRITVQNNVNGTNALPMFFLQGETPTDYGYLGLNSGSTSFIGSQADQLVLETGSAVTNGLKLRTQNQNIYFNTGGATDEMVILPNGNVGVGTTTPDYKLDIVTTDVSLTAGYGKVLKLQSSHPIIEFVGLSGNKSGFIGYDSDLGAGTEGMKFFVNQTPGVLVNTPLLTLKSNQNVGIGTTIPVYKLHVNGTVAGTAAYVNASDKRKKDNIKTIELSGLDIVKKLNPVSYTWKTVLDDGMQGIQMGFIAQELEQILPSIVVTAKDAEQSKGVKYNELLPIYAKAIQEQQKQIEKLNSQNEALLKRIEVLEKK